MQADPHYNQGHITGIGGTLYTSEGAIYHIGDIALIFVRKPHDLKPYRHGGGGTEWRWGWIWVWVVVAGCRRKAFDERLAVQHIRKALSLLIGRRI
jgi:hypothetical protein